jgi:hypothetical protein
MSDVIPRWDPPTSDDVRNRIEDLVSSLLVLDGMTKRGGSLDESYRQKELPSIRRFAGRVLDALEKGERAVQPWDHHNGR